MQSLLLLLFLGIAAAFAQKNPQKQLSELAAAGSGLVTLDSQLFDILTSPKRTWSATVQFTVLSKHRKCNPCKQFNPTFNAVAKAWSQTPADQREEHYFATLDFEKGSNVFQKLGLVSAPIVFLYPAADGPRKPASGKTTPTQYDFRDGFDAALFAEHLSRLTPIPIPYKEPIDWMKWIMTTGALVGGGFLLTLFAPIVLTRWTWAFACVMVCLVMSGGYMFTRIRAVPYAGGDGSWIADGFINQYGQEVRVIAFMYGLLAFSFIMLTLIVPYQSSPSKQRLQIYLWIAVILIMYSVLVSIFRVKNRGYPYRLFL